MFGRLGSMSMLLGVLAFTVVAGCDEGPADAQVPQRADLGYEVVRSNITFPGGTATVLTVTCPAGKVALNGGYEGAIVNGSYPHIATPSGRPATDGTGWEFLSSPTAPTTTATFVICVSDEALIL
jgi:hypothetical protein